VSAAQGSSESPGLVVTRDQAHAYVAALEEAYRPDRPTASPSVAVVDGEGVSVRVRNGHLQLCDGEGWLRRERTYNRATSEIRRLVVTAGSGALSIDALRWCRDAGVAVVVLDGDEALLAQGPAPKVDSRVLRIQAAPPKGLAVDAARYLLRTKLEGQARVAGKHLGDLGTTETITSLGTDLAGAESIDECRQLEASAANAYFGAWEGHPATTLRFARSDLARVPAHWPVFAGRSSPVTKGNYNRRAATPLNACLNYLYKVAAVEVRVAALRIGLHPSLGFVHLDEAKRENLIWDLLETVRPDIDSWLLDLIAERNFRRADFLERSDGSVAIAPALCHDLATTMPLWEQAVAPHAERLYHLLGRAVEGKWEAATPLSRAKAKTAAARVKARKSAVLGDLARRSSGRATKPGAPQLFRTCEACGGALDGAMSARPFRQRYCSACLSAIPNQAEGVRARRGRAIAARKAFLKASAEGLGFPADKEWYRANVLPRLAGHKLSEIVACGVSKGYASHIRSGKYVPNVALWPALARLAGVDLPVSHPAPSIIEGR
jgi:CRISPR-associated endonuclease Cas1